MSPEILEGVVNKEHMQLASNPDTKPSPKKVSCDYCGRPINGSSCDGKYGGNYCSNRCYHLFLED